MPNYTEVGRLIKTLVHSYHCDDPPTYDVEPVPVVLDEFPYDLSLPKLGKYTYMILRGKKRG